jgi:hypothetical protein
MAGTQEWRVNSGRPVDGISTNLRKMTVRNLGPAPVGIRIDGRQLKDQEPGDKTYSLPGTDVLLEVLFLEFSAKGVFEFETFS